MPIPAIFPVLQNGEMDCGLSCLRMLSHKSYDEVLEAALAVAPKCQTRGMFATELIRISARLGIKLRKRKFPVGDEVVGVIDFNLPGNVRHFAVLFQGTIANPADGLIWDLDAYLTAKEATPRAVYVVEDA